MPSGRTHDRLAWLSTVPLVAGTAYLVDGATALAAGAGSLFGGLWFSGDLDTVSRPLKRWGPLAWVWRPYRFLVPHRGVHSHGLVWGPLFRLAYLAFVLVLLVVLVGLLARWAGYRSVSERLGSGLSGMLNGFGEIDRSLVIAVVGGLFYGNAVHSLTDWIVSGAKRARRRARRSRRNERLG